MEDKVFPVIQDFRKRINEFDISNDEHKRIIKRFDEIICEKASKIDIQTLIKDLENYVTCEKYEEVMVFK